MKSVRCSGFPRHFESRVNRWQTKWGLLVLSHDYGTLGRNGDIAQDLLEFLLFSGVAGEIIYRSDGSPRFKSGYKSGYKADYV
jgi:hypothetical protein